MKTFLASALLVLAASAGKETPVKEAVGTAVDTAVEEHTDFTVTDKSADVKVEDGTIKIDADVTVKKDVVDPKPEEKDSDLLMDYVDQEGHEIKDEMEVSKVTHEETAEALLEQDFSEEVYKTGELVSVHGDECEKAIGHDGHYDEATGIWMLEDDFDYEPEWRCLMRPLLKTATTDVQDAELSIESRGILQEKKALVEVHQRLVAEAAKEHEKASCLEHIERQMAKYQECELEVLRTYVQVADAYPTTWVQFLEQKKVCVDRFAEAVAECSRLFIWEPEQFAKGLEMVGVPEEHIAKVQALI